MIARPVIRPHPIPFTEPFAEPAPRACTPRPVSWAASSGPAPQALATVRTLASASGLHAANEASRKRSAAQNLTTQATPPAQAKPSRAPSLFSDNATKAGGDLRARYVGQGALSVRSSVTGRHYRFQGHGDSQKIDKHDMLMLKRIPDLVVG